jgi:acetyl-CoA carboxylase biotin carboxylase subunit
MVTGIDLIKMQLKIAGGQNINLKQRDIKHSGVAIECRINAEDPERNFAPCPGKVDKFILPGGMGVRVDTHIFQGAVVSPYYDSMIAKLIVHRPTRDEAIITMKRALSEFRIGPIKTTIPACLKILSHNLYLQNKVDTSFIEQHLA